MCVGLQYKIYFVLWIKEKSLKVISICKVISMSMTHILLMFLSNLCPLFIVSCLSLVFFLKSDKILVPMVFEVTIHTSALKRNSI